MPQCGSLVQNLLWLLAMCAVHYVWREFESAWNLSCVNAHLLMHSLSWHFARLLPLPSPNPCNVYPLLVCSSLCVQIPSRPPSPFLRVPDLSSNIGNHGFWCMLHALDEYTRAGESMSPCANIWKRRD